MAEVRIMFYRCIHDSKEHGSNDATTVSRLFMLIEIDGQLIGKHYANITHRPHDHNIADVDIKVGPPTDLADEPYVGPMDRLLFRNEAEQYYKGLLDATRDAVNISGHSHNGHTYHNTYLAEHAFTFEATTPESN